MMFSLIIGTIDRLDELGRLLSSLDRQTYHNFEVIVVDQSRDDRFAALIDDYRRRMSIVHLRSDQRGASRARNLGLKNTNGDIIAFPDDDCWYPADLLNETAEWFQQNSEIDGLSVRSLDADFENSVLNWSSVGGPLDRRRIWTQSVEAAIFLRRRVVDTVGLFDETLGVGCGTLWGSGEGTDYLLRAMDRDLLIYYEPAIHIHHPNVVQAYDARTCSRALSYNRGMGRVLRKHRYPMHLVAYYWIRPLGAALLCVITGRLTKARFYLYSFRGRVVGWFS